MPGVSAGNWVFAVGNDWDKAVARTPVSGQVLVHQRVDTQTGDTYWVQSTAGTGYGQRVGRYSRQFSNHRPLELCGRGDRRDTRMSADVG